MDTTTRSTIINKTLQNERHRSTREKLRNLLVERQIPFISSTNDIVVLKTLGYGVFGIVELVSYQKKLYAQKRPKQNACELRNSILDEGIKLTDIAEYHPNIQRLYFINLESYGFLMDYGSCGSFDKIITDNNIQYTLVDVLNWSYQLADALSFLHSNGIMHRDVKMQNILLKDNYQTLILTDYGTATQLGRNLLTNQAGTPITMAPEVCKSTQYAEQCDIYSWSIIFWQLLSKKLSPYNENMSKFDIVMKVVTENLRPYKLDICPNLFVALMYRSWHSDPNERPKLSFIKRILRLILNVLPKNRQEYSEEIINEVKKQWINDYESSEKYLPVKPRLNNEKSMNIYQEHLTIMERIMKLQKDITEMDEKLMEYSKQREVKNDHYKELLNENAKLKEEIEILRKKLH